MTTAIFTGSFDPFTIGHEAIVRQALPLFDRIVIGVGVNGNKTCLYDPQTRVEAIARLYAGETKVEVRQYDDDRRFRTAGGRTLYNKRSKECERLRV